MSDYWGVNRLFLLQWHQWGDTHAVYHPGSGQTHIVDDLAAHTLKLIETEPSNTAELATRLSKSLDMDKDDDLYEYIEKALDEFKRLGLIVHYKT